MTNPVSVPLRGMFPGGNTGQGGLVAAADGLQSDATQLPATVNRVDTVAGAADSVLLPSAIPGSIVFVYNYTATSMQVFGQASNKANTADPTAGDVIVPAGSSTPAATATGVAQAGHTPAIYACAVVGEWKQFLCVD
jgi:hypothetical protein